jgi:Secretion system C-terminal sorting domain
MKKSYLFLLFCIAICSGTSFAQMVECNVFLQGDYMEIGINNNGAFGTSYSPPTGYHPNVSDTMYHDCPTSGFYVQPELGFVVDPARDGWTVGTPHYYGDMIMVNDPREGWAISDTLGGYGTAYSYNYYLSPDGYTGALTGGSVGYTASSGVIQGTWAGSYTGGDSLNITQSTTIISSALELKVHIGFYNTAVTTAATFYYMRVIDPHTQYTSLPNVNKIEHQLPNPDGLVVVSATGTTDTNAYLALGTRDPRAKCFIIKDSTMPPTDSMAAIYAGSPNYQYSDTLTGDLGIGLIYQLNLGPGDSLFLDFGYSFKGGIVDTLLDSSLIDSGLTSLNVKAARIAAITAYPNPATNSVNITSLASGDSYILYDVLGKQLVSGKATNGTNELPLNGLPAGVYLVIVSDANGNAIKRLPISKE